jgi:hypothetical protein
LEEVEDEYDMPTVNDRYAVFMSHFTLSNFFALVVAAKWVVLVLFIGVPWFFFS